MLTLWMNGAFVGTWSLAPNAPDTLQYDLAWTRSEQGRALSLCLPFTPDNAPHRGNKVRAYFENLLPDSKDIRKRIARRYRTRTTDAFDLLAEVGRDCVGALEILPDDQGATGPVPAQAQPLSQTQVAMILHSITAPNILGSSNADLRIAIAGAQEKTALLHHDGQWYLPGGSTPTTHILKLPLGLIGGMRIDMRDSVENEWLCSLILQEFGLPVAACMPMQFEDMKALVVERFDRAWRDSPAGGLRLVRLPQEDLCQATGTPPDAKYEADGGPGMDRILNVLEGSMAREQDRRTFFQAQAQVLFWMLCATDGHAKNFSLHQRPGGRYQLTPLYDVLSAWPVLGEGPGKISPFKARMAMAVRSKNAHWKMRDILRRHWLALGARHGIVTKGGQEVRFILDDLIARTPVVVAAVKAKLPVDFPEQVADTILDGLQDAANRLSSQD